MARVLSLNYKFKCYFRFLQVNLDHQIEYSLLQVTMENHAIVFTVTTSKTVTTVITINTVYIIPTVTHVTKMNAVPTFTPISSGTSVPTA